MEKTDLFELVQKKFKNQCSPAAFYFIWDSINKTQSDGDMDYRIFVDDFNAIVERNFKYADTKAKRQFKAVRKAGYTAEDDIKVFKSVKQDTFHEESDFKYVTPEYITRMNIYEKYRNLYREEKKVDLKIISNPYR
jgi:hypothetical protein